jgi:hypothetical protein
MLRIFKKQTPRIGFVIENKTSYNEAMASTRLRCYDIIQQINRKHYYAEVYQQQSKYDIVVFQKCFQPDHIKLARTFKSQGVKTVLDINVNYIENFGHAKKYVTDEQYENIKKMINIVDAVLVSSPMLFNIYKKYHPSVFCIEEMVTSNFFNTIKKHNERNPLSLLYCGYSKKAEEILSIKNVLIELHNKYNISIVFITDHDPGIDFIPYRFIQYQHEKLPQLLLNGDIKIAPRDLKSSYNIGHSFTKVAYPMSVGIPAVASPVPSYLNREVLICENEQEWNDQLTKLILNQSLRNYYGKRSRTFVKDNFSNKKISLQYIEFLNYLSGG